MSTRASSRQQLVKLLYYVDFNAVKRFVEQGADINTIDKDGHTPLYLFSESYFDSYYTPCMRGYDMPLPDDFYLPLAERNFKIGEMVEWFLDNGADINLAIKVDGCLENPLYSAVAAQDLPMVKLFLERGADPNLQFHDDEGNSALLDKCESYDLRGYDSGRHYQQVKALIQLLKDYGAISQVVKIAAIFIGIPASGKTSFYKRCFAHNYVHINLDTLRTRNKEQIMIAECLRDGRSFVIDNTNPTVKERERYISIAKDAGYRVDGYFFQSVIKNCIERNECREGKSKLPPKAIAAISNKLELPNYSEGFDRINFIKMIDGEFLSEKWRGENEI